MCAARCAAKVARCSTVACFVPTCYASRAPRRALSPSYTASCIAAGACSTWQSSTRKPRSGFCEWKQIKRKSTFDEKAVEIGAPANRLLIGDHVIKNDEGFDAWICEKQMSGCEAAGCTQKAGVFCDGCTKGYCGFHDHRLVCVVKFALCYDCRVKAHQQIERSRFK